MCSIFSCRNILNQFSWLAVHSLAQAAEASVTPVRMGISKPMGASSVMSEYQNTRVPRMSTYHGATRVLGENPQESLARSFHTRRAQHSRRVDEGRDGSHVRCVLHLLVHVCILICTLYLLA